MQRQQHFDLISPLFLRRPQAMGAGTGQGAQEESEASPSQCAVPDVLVELRRRRCAGAHLHAPQIHHARISGTIADSISAPAQK